MLHMIGIANNAIIRILQGGTNAIDAKAKRHPHVSSTTTHNKLHQSSTKKTTSTIVA